MNRRLVFSLVLVTLLALPPAALAKRLPAQPGGGKAQVSPDQAKVKISLGKLKGGKAPIYGKVPVYGVVEPFEPGQTVDVTFYLDGRKLFKRVVKVRRGGGAAGVFKTSIRVREAGKYAASAHVPASGSVRGDRTVRKSWKVSFPALHEGQCGDVVVGFKKAMRKMGYIANSGRCFGGKTARGVLAYRKVNGMSRSMRAGKGLVKRAFAGKGEYEVRHPGAGEHLEAPLAKQVLVFAKGEEPFAVYPVSSGKSSTPTVTGHFSFIRQEPGYNSHGMYYSFYFYGGYAVHGYESVPDYPASHGCIRTFIADQPEIYERINFGEDIFVF
jgi:L,D-transpeptidase catalytic domain